MEINNTDLGVYINEIKMIRPGSRFEKGEHNLNVDWSIEYTQKEDNTTEYFCTLKTIGEIPIKFAIHGFLDCENHNEDLEKRYNEISPQILDKCMKTMINILNSTKNATITIKTVPEVYLSCVPEKL
ncbi:MAG TPA: pilus assembly protein [Methanobacterium sp.]|nr:pilus assembly protein [Methanobacterium sp.]